MKKKRRWLYVIVGVAVLLFAGMVYAWSVLSGPIADEFPQWTTAQLSMTFTLVMILFCLGGLVGGLLTEKVSQKVYLWVSAALFLTGFLLSSRIHSLWELYISFGVVCGFASGFAYNAVLATVGKWFPDKPGLISGILLMGFGFSSFLVGKLYQLFTPATVGAWRKSFVVLGIVTAACMGLCGFFLEKPGDDFRPPLPSAKKHAIVNPVASESTTVRMLQHPTFWLFYLWATLLSAAGIAMVSQASGIAREVGTNINPGTIASVVGMMSIFNGIGRVLLGGLYDRKGRSVTMQMVNALFLLTCTILVVALRQGNFLLLVLGFALAGLAYGGVTPTNAAFISSYYGMKNYALNLPVVVTNLIFASFGSTIAGALYDTTGSYMSTYLMVGCLAVVSIVISCTIGLRDARELRQRETDGQDLTKPE